MILYQIFTQRMATSEPPAIVVDGASTFDATTSTASGQAEESGSIIQPGAHVYQLPPPLKGTLAKIQFIARGGFGDVYQGEWTHEDGKVLVGLKCLKPRNPQEQDAKKLFERRIRRETVIWQRAQHENILPFIGYQMDGDGGAMLVSCWCKNGNLKTYIENHPEMSQGAKLNLLCDAARGLVHLHSQEPPIVHCDVKPDNVMITDETRGALADFGISKLLVGMGISTGLTTAGGAGKAGYQAIELMLDGTANPTVKSDVYSFGGLILATMSGLDPFYQNKTDAPTVVALVSGKLPNADDHKKLPSTDPLWDLMKRCWNSDPSRRPSMNDIVEELEREIQNRSS